jgi:hypothetical protein
MSDLTQCSVCGAPMTVLRSTRRTCSDRCRKHDSRRRLAEALQKVRAAEHDEATIKEANRIKLARKKSAQAARKAEIAKLAEDVASMDAQMRYQILNVSCADFPNAARACGTVDWVVTDPPYPREYLPVYSDLSLAAKRMLKPGGLLVCMDGGQFTEEVKQRLGEHLKPFPCPMIYELGGPTANMYATRTHVGYKPVLLFSNGKYTGPWIDLLVKSKGNDKRYHHWGQSESGMLDIMRALQVQSKDMVVDPFLGGGATGAAALLRGAWFIGGDLKQDSVEESKVRLSKLAVEINASNAADKKTGST